MEKKRKFGREGEEILWKGKRREERKYCREGKGKDILVEKKK